LFIPIFKKNLNAIKPIKVKTMGIDIFVVHKMDCVIFFKYALSQEVRWLINMLISWM